MQSEFKNQPLVTLTKTQIIHVITFTENYDRGFSECGQLKFHN